MALYKGYSSKNYLLNSSFALTDLKLVKSDILSHIWTRKGERVMMPNFGTSLQDIVFEPLDSLTVDRIREELITVIDYDPRVELIDIQVQAIYEDNMVLANINLRYIELNTVDEINLNIVFEDL